MKKLSPAVKHFILFLFTAFATYFYGLIHFSLPVDAELPILSEFMLPNGRWGLNLIRYHLFNGYYPFLTLFTGLFFLSLSAVVINKILRLQGKDALLFGLLWISFPQLAYQLIFITQADGIGLGFFLSVSSLYFFDQLCKTNHILQKLLHGAMIVLSTMLYLSIYQSLVFIPATIYLIKLVLKLQNKHFALKQEIKQAVLYLLLALAGVMAYILSLMVINFELDGGYLQSAYLQEAGESRWGIFFKYLLKLLKGEMYQYNSTFLAATLAYLLTVYQYYKSGKQFWLKTLFLTILLILPFIISISIKSYYHPPRLYMAQGLVFGFMITNLIGLTNIKLLRLAAVLLIIVNCAFVNMLYRADYQIDQEDQYIAHVILEKIRKKYPDFNETATPVYFYGKLSNGSYRINILPADVFGGSIFQWDEGNNYRILSFYKYYKIANFKLTQQNQYEAIKEKIIQMPHWPSEESVQVINNIIVIKLGDKEGTALPQ